MSSRKYRKELPIITESSIESTEASKKIHMLCYEIKNEFPALIEAINYLKPTPVEEYGIYTDGKKLLYNPDYVLSMQGRVIKPAILHIVIHGLLGHFISEYYEKHLLAWSIMDLQVSRVYEGLYDRSVPKVEELMDG